MARAHALLLRLITLLCCIGTAHAADKQLHVGILSSGSYEVRGGLERSLIDGLREQGYVEGKNLIIERRYVAKDLAVKVPETARELAGMKLDAILTTCTPSTRAAKDATTTTPVVMAAVSDPVGQHIIASLARPGNNITGRSSQAEDLLAKRLELLAGVLQKPVTVAVLMNSRNPVHSLNWPRLESAAQQLKLKLMRLDVSTADEVTAAIDSAAQAHAGALFVMPDDPLMYNTRVQIVERAAKHRLPDFHWASDYVDGGGLMSYGENLASSYRAAATYVDKIAKGANPATLPVAQPTRFELVINRKTAKALGLSVPNDVIVRADRVIE